MKSFQNCVDLNHKRRTLSNMYGTAVRELQCSSLEHILKLIYQMLYCTLKCHIPLVASKVQLCNCENIMDFLHTQLCGCSLWTIRVKNVKETSEVFLNVMTKWNNPNYILCSETSEEVSTGVTNR